MLIAGLFMLLPVVSVKIEIVDGLELTLGKISLIKTDVEFFRYGNKTDIHTLIETALNGWQNKDILEITLPAMHFIVFLICLFGFTRILAGIFSIYRTEDKVRKWAARVNVGEVSGELKYKRYNFKIVNLILGLFLLAVLGVALYFPLVLYPWVFKVAGCTLIWVCMLLPIIFLVFAWCVLVFRVVFAFTREEDLKIANYKAGLKRSALDALVFWYIIFGC